MDTPSAAQEPTDNVKSPRPASQKIIMTPHQKVFWGGETMVNEKFRENPIPLSSLPRDAPSPPSTFTPTTEASPLPSASSTSPSHSIDPTQAEIVKANEDGEPSTIETQIQEHKRMLGFPRRKFFIALYVSIGCLILSVILFLIIYLTRPKPSPCDGDDLWLPTMFIQTPTRGYSYLGCYVSMTSDNGLPPVVLNGTAYDKYGPAYDFPKNNSHFNNTDCAILCQGYQYFSTGQEKSNFQTCRCGSNVFAFESITCNRMCNWQCAYAASCTNCHLHGSDLCGAYGFATVYKGS